MAQPNPWLLFVGGIALLNIAPMAWALHAPFAVRCAATVLCIALGLLAMGLGLARYLKKNRAPRPAVRGAGRAPVRPRPGAATKDA